VENTKWETENGKLWPAINQISILHSVVDTHGYFTILENIARLETFHLAKSHVVEIV